MWQAEKRPTLIRRQGEKGDRVRRIDCYDAEAAPDGNPWPLMAGVLKRHPSTRDHSAFSFFDPFTA